MMKQQYWLPSSKKSMEACLVAVRVPSRKRLKGKATIVRMEVPCCGGIEYVAQKALQFSGQFIPWQVVTISTDGKILD